MNFVRLGLAILTLLSRYKTTSGVGIVTDIHLFVSHYGGGGRHAHYYEVEASIAANLANPEVASVHVLYEPTGNDGCSHLQKRIHQVLVDHWPRPRGGVLVDIAEKLGCTETPSRERATLQEVLAIYPSRIFGERAADPSRRLVLVVVNGDIVLDRSVRRLKTLQPGHAAVLSVNTGPDMKNCCFESFHDSIKSPSRKYSSKACIIGAGVNQTCIQSLPDPDTDLHDEALGQFYLAHRHYAVQSGAESKYLDQGSSSATCGIGAWSADGFQFCGTPQHKDISGSWDGYALVLPLPSALVVSGNPWFNGAPPQDDHMVGNSMANAYYPWGVVHMNSLGVEGRTLCGLQSAGLIVHNPCRYIRVAHWHCEAKTHFGKNNRFDRGPFFQIINDYVKDHPEFGLPTNCEKTAMGLSTLECASNCGGINTTSGPGT